MKTVFTILFITVLTSAFAYDEGKITIAVATNQPVAVYVDNRLYQFQGNEIELNNVVPGSHNIRIYQTRSHTGNSRNSRMANQRRQELLYSGTVYVRSFYHVDVMVNRFGKALVDEKALESTNDHGVYGNGYRQAMSTYDFEKFASNIKSLWFSSGKMNTARDVIPKNFFSTSQVRQLLQLFSTDSDRLEIAKLAYRYTIDQRNYYQLNDVFSFESSKEDLNSFVRDFRY
jgi:hypothetical protein